jgi:hypothetical protein
MTTREQINSSAAQYGFRLPTEAEKHTLMLAQHAKMVRLYERVGNADMARQAQAAHDKLAAQLAA